MERTAVKAMNKTEMKAFCKIKYSFKSLRLAMIMLVIASSIGCVFGRTEAPHFDDRTVGWLPKLKLTVEFGLEELDAENSELWRGNIPFTPYSFDKKLSEDNIMDAATEAIKLNLGEAHSAVGAEYELIEKDASFAGNTIGVLTDSILVLFASNTGRLKFCADLNDQVDLKMKSKEALQLTVDLAGLSSSALCELQALSSFNEPVVKPSIGDIKLPLTAQGAFDISVGMDVGSWNGSSRLAATGGAFRVYTSEASNALFVVTNTYVQAFDAETGKLLMMSNYGGGYGMDESSRA